jgi:hypothetical protein
VLGIDELHSRCADENAFYDRNAPSCCPVPAEKYGWRPGPGVRSVSEVMMHTASGNYFSLQSMGVKAGEDLPKNPEKSVTAKADVVRWLKGSFGAVQENYPKIDKQKAVKFLGARRDVRRGAAASAGAAEQ